MMLLFPSEFERRDFLWADHDLDRSKEEENFKERVIYEIESSESASLNVTYHAVFFVY